MLFNSPLFLFLFLPVLLLQYFLVREKWRNLLLLSASIGFYAWGEPRFVIFVVASALFDWGLGRVLARDNKATHRKWVVALAVAQNLSLLVYFKYMNFFVGSFNMILSGWGMKPFAWMAIALPIGISFIVFEKITYVVDLYRGTGKPAEQLVDYLLYVFLFPKLLAGPIIKYHDIAPQLHTRPWLFEDLTNGVLRFSMGFAKKVLIADTMGEVADMMFKLPPDQLGTQTAWIGVLCYTFQIYFDFSGYSDMAIGLARMFGFHIMENFNMPYISVNFTEFWRRWHISLSTWIREYLYIPLGGNRGSSARTYFNLWFCFFLSGLWHGANWTFILWGVYHGFFLALDKLCWLQWQRRLPRLVNVALTFFLVLLGWTVFRAETIYQIRDYMTVMFTFPPVQGSFVYLETQHWFFLGISLLLSFVPAASWYEPLMAKLTRIPGQREVKLAVVVCLFFLAAGKMSTLTFNPFLYFRF